MDSKIKKYIILILVTTTLFVVAVPLNEWMSKTMARHQLIELPIMFFGGIIIGKYGWKLSTKDNFVSVAKIIFVMFTLIFWMLPKSVDLAALNPLIDKIMNLHVFIAGFLTISLLKGTIFEIKILFLGMMAAMIMAVGITLRVFNLLLCSSFSIEQQRETGLYMILISALLYILTSYILISSIARPVND